MKNKKNETRSNEQKLSSCCKPKKDYKGNNVFLGILYGLIPHIGCIMFIIGAILGSTILLQFFRPVLMSRNIFYYLILISIGFATLSSFFYLRKNKCLSFKGIKNKKVYLSIMYGSTVGINLVLFFLIFPMIANITGNVSAEEIINNDLSILNIKVDIPCPGHAPLITNEVKTVEGVKGSEFSFPNNFEVYYDSSLTNEQEILSLEVFTEYSATVIESTEESTEPLKKINKATQLSEVNTGDSCSSGTCGGSCGQECGGCGF